MSYIVDLDILTKDSHYPACWTNLCDHVRADNDYVIQAGGLYNATNQYLKSLDITRIEHPRYHVVLEFESEVDFLFFKLKWS